MIDIIENHFFENTSRDGRVFDFFLDKFRPCFNSLSIKGNNFVPNFINLFYSNHTLLQR